MATKQISIDSLVVGMYLCGIDRPWFDTPFLRHRFLIKSQDQIDKLRQCGVHHIQIDTNRGTDVIAAEPEPATPSQEDPNESGIVALMNPAVHYTDDVAAARINALPSSTQGTSLTAELHAMKACHEDMLHGVQDILTSLSTTGSLPPAQMKEVTHSIIAKTLEHEDACLALVRTRDFSADLHEHAMSVGTLAVLLARVADYSREQLQTIATAALLHDIGLLRLPKELLTPHGRETPDALALYRTHPQLGVELLQECSGISDHVRRIVAEHHVTLDGRGYPSHISPEEICPETRLLQVVDLYDEILTGQHLSNPDAEQDTLGELYRRSQAKEIDAQLVSQFVAQVGIYPTYSLVELSTGERGIVMMNSKENLLEPTILLIQNADGTPIVEPIPISLSTLRGAEGDTRRPEITKVLNARDEGIKIDECLGDWVTM